MVTENSLRMCKHLRGPDKYVSGRVLSIQESLFYCLSWSCHPLTANEMLGGYIHVRKTDTH